MNVQRLLDELHESGVHLTPRGDRLHVDAPTGVITEQVRRRLVRYKPELLRLLRSSTPSKKPDALREIPGAEQVAAMRLDDFAEAGLLVADPPDVLGADVFVSDNAPESKLEGRPAVVYRAHELKTLAQCPLGPEPLREVHMVKEILGGEIQSVEVQGSEHRPRQRRQVHPLRPRPPPWHG